MFNPAMDDFEVSETPKNDPLSYLPANLRAAAAKLPKGKQHTVLELPPEGSGHNAGLVRVAAICYKMGVSYADTVAHLSEIYSDSRPDHGSAPARAATRIWEGNGELAPDPDAPDGVREDMPDMQDEMLLRFRRTTAAELVELSPHKTNIKPAAIIEALFNQEEIINIQCTQHEAGTLVRVKELREKFPAAELATYKFLNPSTFKKLEGVPAPTATDKNKVSTRCNANVKERPYMVLEMDTKDEAMVERFTAFAIQLSNFVPLAMAVSTGGKSIHFWFDAREAEKAQVSALFALACLHGADKRMGVRSQIARMPNVSAGDEGRGAQRVLYYDPDRERYPDNAGSWDVAGFEKVIQKAQQLSYYYLGDGSGRYFGQANTNSWIAFNRNALGKQLVKQGFRENKLEGEVLSPVDEIITSIEMDKSIEAALKGASGRHAGYYEENGHRMLVLKSPVFIKPRAGGFPTIKGFLEQLLDHDVQKVQLDVFYGWLSASMKDLRNNGKRRAKFTPAQMLHIIGPPDSGKSLLLKYILPACLGGRSADCDALFEEKGASFNSDMFQSELLYLDDSDVLKQDFSFRVKFGERIKSFTVGAGGSYHQKFGDKVPIPPWWRFIRVMNNEPNTIGTLPPLEVGVADKLIILTGRSMDGGIIDKTKPGWFEPVRDAIEDELPAFIHFLLEVYRIPAHIHDPGKRYAVLSYHAPEILGIISEDSPEEYLKLKIAREAYNVLFHGGDSPFSDEGDGDAPRRVKPRPWEGSATELYETLMNVGGITSKLRFQKVIPTPRVLGAMMRKMQTVPSLKGMFQYSADQFEVAAKKNGSYYWTINPKFFNNESFAAPPDPLEEVGITEDDCI